MESMVTSKYFFEFYKNKKVFITGHTGFKGSWLMSWLYLMGADLKGYALPPEGKEGLSDLLEPLQLGKSVFADIRDKPGLLKEIAVFQPDIVFHLAAQPLVRRSYEVPAETFDINVVGTANLLEAVNLLPNKCTVIAITTDKVYENKHQDILYREDDILGGYDPYSASKACAELVINSFRSSFFNAEKYNSHHKAIASARAGNVIGGGDWSKDRIIPDIVRSLQCNKVIEVRNPKAVRPWQHVLEPIAGYLIQAMCLHENPDLFSKAYNFGPMKDDHLTVEELVKTSIECWGTGIWKDISDRDHPHETALLKLDISRAMTDLKWHPKLHATAAIRWTLDWYKQPKDKRVDFTFNQIKAYLTL